MDFWLGSGRKGEEWGRRSQVTVVAMCNMTPALCNCSVISLALIFKKAQQTSFPSLYCSVHKSSGFVSCENRVTENQKC